MFHKGFLPVATLAVVVAIAGGQYQQSYDPYRTDYVEQPYHQPAYPSSYRQPESEYPAYIRTTTSSYNRPAYQQQPSRYSGYSREPQGYPTAQSQYPQQPYPQQSYQQPQPAANSYAPKAPAYAAICDFNTGSGTDERVGGRLTLTQDKGYDSPVTISGHITYLKPGKHGFHIHMYADFSDKCTSAGPHYNPLKVSHGSPNDPKNSRHIGDLGNIEAGYDGVAQIHIVDELVSLAEGGKFPIAGRAIVVHEKPDDLGRGGDEESGKTGNAGGRLRCCMIRYVDPTKLPKEY